MKPFLLCLLALSACTAPPRVPSVVHAAKEELAQKLIQRRSEVVDLQAVGKNLVAKHGQTIALQVVRETWDDLAAGDSDKVCDVMWLKDQHPFVQDIAWMLCYQSQWTK